MVPQPFLLPLFTNVVEGAFSEDEMRRPTPIRSTLKVCKCSTGFYAQYGRRIGPPWMVAANNHR